MRTTPRRLGAATGEVLLKLGKSLPRMAPSRSYMTTRTSCPRTRGRAGADAQAYGVWRLPAGAAPSSPPPVRDASRAEAGSSYSVHELRRVGS